MASLEPRIPDVYGPGTHTDAGFTPVTQDTERIFRLLASQTPGFTRDEKLLSKVRFEGEDYPVLPGPIKSVSVGAAVHAMVGVVADEILALRGAADPDRQITVNTTHVALWFANVAAVFLDGKSPVSMMRDKTLASVVPDWERGWIDTPLKVRGTAIYPTRRPGSWFCVHGSLDCLPMLRSLGVDTERPDIKTPEQAAEHISARTQQLLPEELEMNAVANGFCGTICFTPRQWAESAMGRALDEHPLVYVRPLPSHAPPSALPSPPATPFPPLRPADRRPLAGVRVVELTRIIAGPQIGTYLAALGADVVRVNAPHLRDVNMTQLTLNAGKRTIALDLRAPDDAARLRALLADADVVIQGFRMNRLRRFGIAEDELAAAAARRGRGVVIVSENCYGPDGCYAERPGWQQIADCASGAAHVTGRAMGLADGECVLPALPISDMTTGAVAVVGTLLALRDRAVHGGSYAVHATLVAADVVALRPDIGLYSPETVAAAHARFGWPQMRASHHVLDLLRIMWEGWSKVLGPRYVAEDSGWYVGFPNSPFNGMRLSILRPVLRFSDADCSPAWRTPSVPHGFHNKEDVFFTSHGDGEVSNGHAAKPVADVPVTNGSRA